MKPAVKGVRAERAQATRQRILGAATELFVSDGYLQTTMADIARASGVAVQTLYLTYGGKVAILSAALDVAIVGDDEPVPVLERPWHDAFAAEPDGRVALGIFVRTAAAVIERHHPLWSALRAASADPEPAELFAANKASRFVTHSTVATELATKSGFTRGLDPERAGQVVYALMSQETYGLLVVEKGWSVGDWSAWVERHIAAELFVGD